MSKWGENIAKYNRLECFSLFASIFYTNYIDSGSTKLFFRLFVYVNVFMLFQGRREIRRGRETFEAIQCILSCQNCPEQEKYILLLLRTSSAEPGQSFFSLLCKTYN